jgi:hypothetical protein
MVANASSSLLSHWREHPAIYCFKQRARSKRQTQDNDNCRASSTRLPGIATELGTPRGNRKQEHLRLPQLKSYIAKRHLRTPHFRLFVNSGVRQAKHSEVLSADIATRAGHMNSASHIRLDEMDTRPRSKKIAGLLYLEIQLKP